jgi:hypothetical protein
MTSCGSLNSIATIDIHSDASPQNDGEAGPDTPFAALRLGFPGLCSPRQLSERPSTILGRLSRL